MAKKASKQESQFREPKCYRKNFLNEIAVVKPNSTLIIGEAGLGKTILLNSAYNKLNRKRATQQGKLLVLKLRPFGTLSDTADSLFADIVSKTVSFAKDWGYSLPRGLSRQSGSFDQYRNLLSHFSKKNNDFRTILLLDDLERIGQSNDSDLTFSRLRNLLDFCSLINPVFLIAFGTSQVFLLENGIFSLLRSRLQPHIYLGPLDPLEASEMIKDLCETCVPPKVEKTIRALTGDNPYLIKATITRAMEYGSDLTSKAMEKAASEIVATDRRFSSWLQSFELRELIYLLHAKDKTTIELASVGYPSARKFQAAGFARINYEENTVNITCKMFTDWLKMNSRRKVDFTRLKSTFGWDIDAIETLIRYRLRAVVGNKEVKKINEKFIQSCIAHLFSANGVSYDKEGPHIRVGPKYFIPDFSFEELNMALEVKLVKNRIKLRSIFDEMIADNEAYKKQFSYRLFVIYDTGGSINDSTKIINYFNDSPEVEFIIIKH